MNNINLIISGNLTGFSRFYASPTASEICSEAKFDLDYRNYLTFLINTDKAYAVSFSPSTLAVSLVTRILDSFRRPGILVVSLLLPRRTKIEAVNNNSGQNALYQLLNEIYEKFNEKNFVNGMVNQNPAVLMQDYYTDILNKYVLSSDSNQRLINSSIDASTANKRVAYVRTTEDNVPLYLSSICRKSYEGFHHVFFSQNAGSNGSLIEEEPEEIVTYSVLVTNNNHRIPVVRLSDQIYDLKPSIGEIDIEKNYTYQQILEGASSEITAFIQNDTIEITYRFRQEERTIHFVFKDGQNDVPFDLIAPSIQFLDDNTKYNMPNENYTFLGKEITASKTICCESNNYVIKEESSRVDISRLKDGDIYRIYVEPCFTVDISFSQPMEKSITFKRRNSTRPIVVPGITSHIFQKLPGTQDEWEFTIEANGYKRIKRNVGEFIRTGNIPYLERITTPESATGKTAKGVGTNVHASSSPNIFNSQGSGGLVLTGIKSGPSNPVPQKNKNKKVIYIFTLLLLVVGGALYIYYSGKGNKEPDTPQEETLTSDEKSMNEDTTFTVSFTLLDINGDVIKKNRRNDSYKNWKSGNIIDFKFGNGRVLKENEVNEKGEIPYTLHYDEKSSEYPISLELTVIKDEKGNSTPIELLQSPKFDPENPILKIRYTKQDIDDYYELITMLKAKKTLVQKRYNDLSNTWEKHGDTKGLKDAVLFLLEKLKPKEAPSYDDKSTPKQETDEEIRAKREKISDDKPITDIESTAITLKTLNNLLNDPTYQKQKAHINEIIKALKNLQEGKQPTQKKLPKSYKDIIKNVWATNKNEPGGEWEQRKKTLEGHEKLKNIQSFDEFEKVAMRIINNSKK